MEYKTSLNGNFIKESIKNIQNIDEESDLETEIIKERKKAVYIVSLINKFNGEFLTDDVIKGINYLCIFSKTATQNYKTFIARNQIFEKLFLMLNFSSEREDYVEILMNCIASLTSKGYQTNTFFVSHTETIEIIIKMLENPNLVNVALSVLKNIIFDQLVCRDVFIDHFSPLKICEMIEAHKQDNEKMFLLSKLVASCNIYPYSEDSLASVMFNATCSLLFSNFAAVNREQGNQFYSTNLFSLQKILDNTDFLIKENVKNTNLIRMLMSFVSESELEITERVLLIIQCFCGAPHFDESLVDIDLLFSLKTVGNNEFKSILDITLGSFFINERFLMFNDEELEKRMTTINELISEMSFQNKVVCEKHLSRLIANIPAKELSRLLKYGLLDSVLLFNAINTRDGIAAFLVLCKVILRVGLTEDKGTAEELFNFFDGEEIIESVEELLSQDSENQFSDDNLIKNRAELMLNAVNDIRSYIES